ncbi:MAG: 30S ribosomal protein S8 [Candidatus Omnitrophota bacterium]|nr:30S ribosomal protein S8 [Candidatus Omnitrophota bacterium]
MSVTDLIADQLTVIRNAIRIGKKTVIIKKSGIIEGIVDIIKREGFIDNYKVIDDNKQGQIKIYLKYLDDGTPVMEELKRVSKCGRREYTGAKKVKSVMGGVGIAILSTSKGLLTDKEAKDLQIGGELVCQIW